MHNDVIVNCPECKKPIKSNLERHIKTCKNKSYQKASKSKMLLPASQKMNFLVKNVLKFLLQNRTSKGMAQEGACRYLEN